MFWWRLVQRIYKEMNKKYFRIWLVHGFLVDYREQEREWIQQQRAEHRDQEEENSSLLRTKIPFSDAQPHTISGRHGWTSTHFRAGSFIVTVTVTWEEKNARHHHFWKKERSKKKKIPKLNTEKIQVGLWGAVWHSGRGVSFYNRRDLHFVF